MPVPFAAVFQPVNVWFARVKVFTGIMKSLPCAIVIGVIVTPPPFALKLTITVGACLYTITDTLRGLFVILNSKKSPIPTWTYPSFGAVMPVMPTSQAPPPSLTTVVRVAFVLNDYLLKQVDLIGG